MAYSDTKSVTTGSLLSGALANLTAIPKQIAIYFGSFLALSLAGVAASRFGEEAEGVLALITFSAYWVGQCWLYRAVLSKAGRLGSDQPMRPFRLFGMALVIFLPIYFGMALLFIPGIILASLWIAAPSFLTVGEGGVFASMGASWRAVSGSILPVALAFAVLFLMFFVIFMLLSGLDSAMQATLGFPVFTIFSVHVLPILLMGLSTAAYCQLADGGEKLAETFA